MNWRAMRVVAVGMLLGSRSMFGRIQPLQGIGRSGERQISLASGVAVKDDCITLFNDLKLKHNMKYIIYKMNDKMTEIQVHKTEGTSATYEQFVAEFPAGDCRYGVFDVEYTDPKTGGQRNKIVFYSWCDDNAPVKKKMIYASSKDELKKRLVGIATEVQANDKAGLDFKDVVERVSKV